MPVFFMATIPTCPWVSTSKFMGEENHELLASVCTIIIASTLSLMTFRSVSRALKEQKQSITGI